MLFGAISLGTVMNLFMSYQAFGWGIVVYRDFLYLGLTGIMAVFYNIKAIRLTTALIIISYFILTCYVLVLFLIFKTEDFSFYSYFLEIRFLVMLFGLILTIGIRPYHDLILGSYNLIFSTVCLFYIQEFQVETYMFYISIVTAKCIICFVIFEQVFKLRRRMKIHTETIIRQNAELLELTNFRKDIVRIIAHDLRSPVHQMASLLNFIEYSKSEEDRKEIMGYMKKSVNNAYDMLENLLNWAMKNNDSLKEYTTINVKELIHGLENQLAEQLHFKKLRIDSKIDFNAEIYYSKNVIESVTRNLLLNAVKFSPTDNDITVCFENKDTSFSLKFFNKTGDKEQENVHRFNKGDKHLNSTNGTANEKGSGNGLLVCRQMLEKNNGELILAAENDGVMATVCVTLTL